MKISKNKLLNKITTKKILIFCLFLLSNYFLNSQNDSSRMNFSFGFRLNTLNPINELLGPDRFYLFVSPEIGFLYNFPNSSFSVSYSKSFIHGSDANKDLSFSNADSSSDYDENDFFDINYSLKSERSDLLVSLGYFHKKHITPSFFGTRQNNFNSNGSFFEYRGISIGLGLRMPSFNLELKKFIQLTPQFALFEKYLYALSISKDVSFVDFKKHNRVKRQRKIMYYLLTSISIQPNKYYFKVNQLLYNPASFVLGVGVGFSIKNYGISIELKRNVWKQYTGGILSNDLIGYISYNKLLISKRYKKIGIGMSYDFIKNTNEKPRMGIKKLVDQNGTVINHRIEHQMNVFGVGLQTSYYFSKRTRIEYNHIFPYVGENFLTIWYSSIGVTYIL